MQIVARPCAVTLQPGFVVQQRHWIVPQLQQKAVPLRQAMAKRVVQSQKATGSPPAQPEPPGKPAKPLLRGTVHHYAAFVALAMGIMLLIEAPNRLARLGCLVHTISTTAMFGVSAAYHRPNWSPENRAHMRKLDHAAIFLLIAGTNTPLALLGLPWIDAFRLLTVVWSGALVGMLQPVLLPAAPKAIKACIYVALGWVAFPYAGQLRAALGPATELLIVGGGIVYSVGAVVYALRRPDPFPATFGYHEVFHAFVTLAALMHFAAVYRVVRAPPLA